MVATNSAASSEFWPIFAVNKMLKGCFASMGQPSAAVLPFAAADRNPKTFLQAAHVCILTTYEQFTFRKMHIHNIIRIIRQSIPLIVYFETSICLMRSKTRLEYPASLSYQETSLTKSSVRAIPAFSSKTEEEESEMKSEETTSVSW